MFKINTQQARAYDQRGGYINEAGKYTGIIKAAVWHIGESPKGRSENVNLVFESDSKQKATFFINTSYQNGIPNDGGIQTINALLECLRERDSGDPTPATITEYNPDSKQDEQVQRECFTKLHNKRIGIVVQMEWQDGQDKPQPRLYSLFEADTELTASEVLDQKTQPEKLGKIMAYIAEKPLHDKRKTQSAPQPPQRQATQPAPALPVDDIDDDIPF